MELNDSQLNEPKIDLLKSERARQKKRFFLFRKWVLFSIVFIIILVGGFSYKVISSEEGIIYNLKKMNFLGTLYEMAKPSEDMLRGENEDRINLLITGMGGAGHPGPYLTDTIILGSYKPSTNQVSMVSIPRDLNVPINEWEWRKINSINAYAEAKEPGSGAEVLAEKISSYLDIPIHYYVRIDFSGFEDLIDELGGIEVCVDRTFTDIEYPTLDYKYQTVHFDEGCQKMDGDEALKYVRSRHGNNGEAGDFARSRRQQKVIMALKDEIFSFTTFFSLRKVERLLETYNENIATNFEVWELMKGIKLAKDVDLEDVITKVLSDEPGGPLYSTIINSAYVLLPKQDDFAEVKEIVNNIFGIAPEVKVAVNDTQKISQKVIVIEEEPVFENDDIEENESVSQQVSEEIELSDAKIEILNGTNVEGLAASTKLILENIDFKVVKIGNAKSQDYTKTEIYDFTQGKRSSDLEKIKEELGIDINVKPSLYINGEEGPDFLLILGSDWGESFSP